jgi:DNA-directed RNA polymerase subunit N (RpoN/RPB10)
MIIPIRCFNCGQLLASKYRTYMNLINSPVLIRKEDEKGVYFIPSSELDTWDKKDEVTIQDRNQMIQDTLRQIDEEQRKLEDIREIKDNDKDIDSDSNQFVLSRQVQEGNKNIEGLLLNQIGLSRYCCRSHMIGHVQIIDKL